jgi:hypothetical protein
MSSFNTISTEKLARLIGVPHGPALIDVRGKEDFAADPRFIPGAIFPAPSAGLTKACRPGRLISRGGRPSSSAKEARR